MANNYEIGFKDVYPWVWSVMFAVVLTLAIQRQAFLPTEAEMTRHALWLKNVLAVAINVIIPVVFFSWTMVRIGPLYPHNLGFWDILGCLWFAGLPLGVHQGWLLLAKSMGWLPSTVMEKDLVDAGLTFCWLALGFGIPALATILGVRLPPR